MIENNFILRAYTEDDRAFIESSWAKSYYDASPVCGMVSPEVFFSFHRPLRERFFARKDSQVIVCAAESDPNQILGWVAFEEPENCTLIHYVYVKSTYRKEFHILRRLINAAIVDKSHVVHTHLTRRAAEIMNEKGIGWLYEPQLT